MSQFSRTSLVVFGLMFSLAGWPSRSNGDESATIADRPAAQAGAADALQDLIDEALHREIYGQSDERRQLLARVLATDPDNASARWHAGYLQHEGRWIKAAELPELLTGDAALAEYGRVRDTFAETAASQLELANWCAARGLADRQRAHLYHVLSFDPNHAEARGRLGFELVDGRWVSSAERKASKRQSQQAQQSLTQFRAQMYDVRSHLDAGQRDAAKAILLAIDDPQAVWAIELLLATHSEPAAELALQAMARLRGSEVTLALARQSLNSQWPAIRTAAADCLGDRATSVYAPFLLSCLCTTLQPSRESIRYHDGQLVLHRSFVREREDRQDVVVYESAYNRVARERGERNETFQRMRDELNDDRHASEEWLEQSNQRRQEINHRIAAALRRATGEDFSGDPRDLWNWWNNHNEIQFEGQKPKQMVFHLTRIEIEDRVPPPPPPRPSKDCLTAGTPVWTSSGAVAVEAVRVGDLVLSQDPDTGELAYKPVLRTTERSKSNIVRLCCGDETIDASGGHNFWVSGEGWIKARELASGMEIHTVAGTSHVVNATSREDVVAAYNLEVADFHTYFVGRRQMLSHDCTARRPTDAVVPGLVP